jgi:hypothetical protein
VQRERGRSLDQPRFTGSLGFLTGVSRLVALATRAVVVERVRGFPIMRTADSGLVALLG